MKADKFFLSAEEEEKWLNHMSDEGYRFVGKSGFSYQFESSEKGAYRYYIDQRGFLKNNKDFVGFLNELNLKLAARQWGFYYFEADGNSSTQRIYTDIKSKIYFYLRCILWLVFVGVINVSIMNSANGPYFLNISIPFAANGIILCLVLLIMIRHIRGIFLLCMERQRNECSQRKP